MQWLFRGAFYNKWKCKLFHGLKVISTRCHRCYLFQSSLMREQINLSSCPWSVFSGLSNIHLVFPDFPVFRIRRTSNLHRLIPNLLPSLKFAGKARTNRPEETYKGLPRGKAQALPANVRLTATNTLAYLQYWINYGTPHE